MEAMKEHQIQRKLLLMVRILNSKGNKMKIILIEHMMIYPVQDQNFK